MLSNEPGRSRASVRRPPAHNPEALAGVPALQRSAGNHAVASLLSVQRVKLSNGLDTDDLSAEQLLGLLVKAKTATGGGKGLFTPGGAKKVKPVTLKLKKAPKAGSLLPGDITKIERALARLANDEEFIAEADPDVMDEIDAIVGGVPDFKGAESGGEHGFTADSTYFDKPPNLRPDKGSALFHAIYVQNATKATVQGAPPLLSLACQEPGCTLGGTVYFAATAPWSEFDPTSGQLLAKAPPICHKTPYAVMVRALLQVVTETTWKTAIQPGAAGWDDMHRELAWGITNNLGPGHAACNSRTAQQGKRQPTATEVTYVRNWAKQNNYVS